MKLETKLKHTPGPWRAPWLHSKRLQYSIDGGPCEDANTDPLDWVRIQLTGDAEALAANARLVAAAPDLLDALMHVVALLHATYDALDEYVAAGDDMLRNPLNNKRVQDIADMATDALNKAIGENQE
tara:strand:+ start:451 stop:831 length:381 start_codon:yes stop_codon:yes gene_type:complete